MMRLILGVAAALTLLAGQAAADGLPTKGHVKAADTVAAPNWNGFYIGVGVGAGAVVHDLSVQRLEHEVEYEGWRRFLSLDGIGGEGVFGTIIVGYDRVIRPGWVAGIFADFDFSQISTDLSVSHYFNASLDHRHSWSLGARLGMLTSPTTLWYATAGYTRAEFDVSSSEFSYGLRSPTFNGYFLGGGVESLLRDNWSLRLEYRFTQFNSETVFDGEGIRADLEPSMHTARLVLTYKLGHRD